MGAARLQSKQGRLELCPIRYLLPTELNMSLHATEDSHQSACLPRALQPRASTWNRWGSR